MPNLVQGYAKSVARLHELDEVSSQPCFTEISPECSQNRSQSPETTKGNQHKVDSPSIFRGGEGGIRTLEAFRLTHFPGVLLRPLGHLSTLLLCRRALPFSTERRVFYGLSREIASLFLIRHWAARRSVRGLLNRVHHRSRADGSIRYCLCLAR